jgi:hypothetical protein
MPSVSELPNFISSIRHPKRNRSISIGPQSAADAYEVLAFRQQKRRESLSDSMLAGVGRQNPALGDISTTSRDVKSATPRNGKVLPSLPLGNAAHALETGNGNSAAALLSPPHSRTSTNLVRTPSQDRRENEKEEKEIFQRIEKPRVRYDVEVITKLIVYSGIGWIAVEGAPILFQKTGLGIYSG